MKKLLISLGLILMLAVPAWAARTDNRIESLEQKRQEFTERINTQLNHINQRVTTALKRVLSRMDNLLNRLRSRVAKAQERGLNTSATEAAIDKAQAAIDSARTAVEAQAEKEYVIEFTDESGLRVGASNAKTALRNDLKAVREKVRAARQAVVDALKAAKAMYAKASPLPEVSP